MIIRDLFDRYFRGGTFLILSGRMIPAVLVSAFFLCLPAVMLSSQELPVVGPEVFQSLATNPIVRVVIAFRRPSMTFMDLASKMVEIARMRSQVLARLPTQDFVLSHSWDTIFGIAGEVTENGLVILMSDPNVLGIGLDERVHVNLAESVPLIQADDVIAGGFTGEGVTVAVLDSGIDTDHPDLSDDLIAEQCFCNFGCCPDGSSNQSGPGAAEDDDGHGTHVSGIITSAGIVAPMGVAPEAGIVSVKILDSSGSGSVSQILDGLDWVIQKINLNEFDIKVVNMSLGGDILYSSECDNANAVTMAYADAIDTLTSLGTTVFVSSGNAASGTGISAPACVANAVSVGAVYDANVGNIVWSVCHDPQTAADKVACFTNSNETLDLMAPGALTTSTYFDGGTAVYGGTSQAAPHAAGAAAVLLELDPTLTPAEIESVLENTGVSVTDAKNGLTFPRIDLLAAHDQVFSSLLADLVLTKTDSPDPVSQYSTLIYTIYVSNAGPSDAQGVMVTDILPGDVTYDSAITSQGSCTEIDKTVQCDLGELLTGESATVTITVIPTVVGLLSSTASVTSDLMDPDTTNNSDTEETTVNPPSADLSITKTDWPDPVSVDGVLVYEIGVSNLGPDAATVVTVTDTLDLAIIEYLSVTSTQGMCSDPDPDGKVSCILGDLASSASATVTISVKPIAEGTINNTADVAGNENDPTMGNNSAATSTEAKIPLYSLASASISGAGGGAGSSSSYLIDLGVIGQGFTGSAGSSNFQLEAGFVPIAVEN